jgi:hypothetical protein
MAHWSEDIERQIIMALAQRNVESGHFDPDGSEQLWSWQGKRRVAIKDVLGLELPAVYGPPRAELIEGKAETPEKGQLWRIETERDNQAEVFLRSAPPADQLIGYILRLFDQTNRAPQEAFCESMSHLGRTGLATSLRGAESAEKLAELAEIYLGLGRCYGDVTVIDLMRILDHLEDQFRIDSEPIVLMVSGYAIPLGLAYGAIDQRVSGFILDYTDAPKAVNEPTGIAPFFLGQYSQLGANPGLVMLQCCAPRPMVIVGRPPKAEESWLKDSKAGVLSFTAQLEELKRTYDSAGCPERLTIIEPDQPKPTLEELTSQIIVHFSDPDA